MAELKNLYEKQDNASEYLNICSERDKWINKYNELFTHQNQI